MNKYNNQMNLITKVVNKNFCLQLLLRKCKQQIKLTISVIKTACLQKNNLFCKQNKLFLLPFFHFRKQSFFRCHFIIEFEQIL